MHDALTLIKPIQHATLSLHYQNGIYNSVKRQEKLLAEIKHSTMSAAYEAKTTNKILAAVHKVEITYGK